MKVNGAAGEEEEEEEEEEQEEEEDGARGGGGRVAAAAAKEADDFDVMDGLPDFSSSSSSVKEHCICCIKIIPAYSARTMSGTGN